MQNEEFLENFFRFGTIGLNENRRNLNFDIIGDSDSDNDSNSNSNSNSDSDSDNLSNIR